MTARAGTRPMLLLALAAALATPRASQAQTPAYAATAQLDTTTDGAILREIERASSRGIPSEPLLAKVREGRLKRASIARIRSAVAALAVRLDSARTALGSNATPEELAAGADALAAGATPAALRDIRAAAPSRPIGAPLGALAQLVASGVSSQRATAMITELLRRNVAAGQVVAFGNAVEADAAGGVPADESALFRLHSIGGPGAVTAATALDAPSASTMMAHPKSAPTPKRRP